MADYTYTCQVSECIRRFLRFLLGTDEREADLSRKGLAFDFWFDRLTNLSTL